MYVSSLWPHLASPGISHMLSHFSQTQRIQPPFSNPPLLCVIYRSVTHLMTHLARTKARPHCTLRSSTAMLIWSSSLCRFDLVIPGERKEEGVVVGKKHNK